MSMDTLQLLLHPVRIRIVHALYGGLTRTTSDLCDRLPDVSKATVYRQVTMLVNGGLLEVAGEQRVHGAVERHYRLNQARVVVDPAAAASMSVEDHRHGFAAAVAALVAEFNAYLDRAGANPTADLVGYRQIPLWLSQAELNDLVQVLTAAVAPKTNNKPTANRRRYLLSPIMFPIEGFGTMAVDDQSGRES